eukprot:gene10740-11929_t
MDPLIRLGFFVLPFPASNEFDLPRFLEDLPEFMPNADEFTADARGAFGNPSSFHHPAIRRLRRCAHENVRPLLAQLFPNAYMQCWPGQFYLRPANACVEKTPWRRDCSNSNRSGSMIIGLRSDRMFGGWINLDATQTQHFSCAPTTHLDNNGFDPRIMRDQQRFDSLRHVVEIPPGHMILFDERLVCEEDTHVYPQPSCDVADSEERLKWFSALFVPECCDPLTHCVFPIMPSLGRLGLPLFDPYSKEDSAILHLHKIVETPDAAARAADEPLNSTAPATVMDAQTDDDALTVIDITEEDALSDDDAPTVIDITKEDALTDDDALTVIDITEEDAPEVMTTAKPAHPVADAMLTKRPWSHGDWSAFVDTRPRRRTIEIDERVLWALEPLLDFTQLKNLTSR